MTITSNAYEEKCPEEYQKEYLAIYNFYVEFFKKKDISFTLAHFKTKDIDNTQGCAFTYSKNQITQRVIIKFYSRMIQKHNLNCSEYFLFSNEELKFFDMLNYETSSDHYVHTKQEVEDWIYDI